jgi:hypothetical protein
VHNVEEVPNPGFTTQITCGPNLMYLYAKFL